jgi:uncharacterized membrane protein
VSGDLTRRDRRWVVGAVWLFMVLFAVTFAVLALRRHAALATNGMDLGNVDQTLWNTAHGHFLAFTNMAPVANRLALHVEPILLLLVPFYWLGLGGPHMLLIVQALVVAVGALPLYWLARDELPSQHVWLHIVFPFAYLLTPALQAAVLYDFHAVTLAPTLLLFTFYYMENERPWRFALFAGLAVACKEDMALVVAMMGVYALLSGRRWRWGLLTIVLPAVWFGLALFLIQPAFSPTGANVQADRYAWLGSTPAAVLGTFFRQPGMVWRHVWQTANLPAYLAGLLWPTGFLALLSPLTWLPALPSLAVNLLSDNPFSWRLEDFHYGVPIVPFLFISAVWGVRHLAVLAGRLRGRWSSRVVVAAGVWLLLAAVAYSWGRGFSPLSLGYQSWPVTDHTRRAQAVFDQVPPDAALFAQSNLNPHVSQRRVLYQDPTVVTEMVQGTLETEKVGLSAPDTLLFDVATLVNADDFQRQVIMPLLWSGEWEVEAADDGFLLLTHSSTAAPVSLPESFYTFARADVDRIAYPVTADFGEEIRLLGFDLVLNRAEEVQPVVYLQALRPLTEDYRVNLFLLDGWGHPLGATTERQPALIWYPPLQWQPGEVVQVQFNTLPWYTRDLPSYRLALGIHVGDDVWQPAARLRPVAPPGGLYAPRLLVDGTLLELARFEPVCGFPRGGPPVRVDRVPLMQHKVFAAFGDQIELLGYDLVTTRALAPDGLECVPDASASQGTVCRVDLVLYWRALEDLNEDYTIFVHLISSVDGSMWAQRDAQPDGGGYATSRWRAGEVVVDPLRIELTSPMPVDAFDLVVGLYQAGSGERLPRLDGDGIPVDDKIVFPEALR